MSGARATEPSGPAALRGLLEGPEILVVPGVADAITGRIAEAVGFQAVYATGAGFANSQFGVPDIGLVTMVEVADNVARIVDATGVPVIVDADTGYGGVLNVYRTVRVLERAGAAAIQLEDQRDPKRCGHFDGQVVVSQAEMIDRIAAALDARIDPDLAIVARTDARESESFEAALERVRAYAAAGADVVFFEAPRSDAELAEIPKRLDVPCLVNVVEGGKTPTHSAAELEALGYRIALFANAALRVMMHSIRGAMEILRAEGTTASLLPRMATWEERQDLVGLPEYQALEDRLMSPAPEPAADDAEAARG